MRVCRGQSVSRAHRVRDDERSGWYGMYRAEQDYRCALGRHRLDERYGDTGVACTCKLPCREDSVILVHSVHEQEPGWRQKGEDLSCMTLCWASAPGTSLGGIVGNDPVGQLGRQGNHITGRQMYQLFRPSAYLLSRCVRRHTEEAQLDAPAWATEYPVRP